MNERIYSNKKQLHSTTVHIIGYNVMEKGNFKKYNTLIMITINISSI